MINDLLRATSEYKHLLAGIEAKPSVVALFGLPPSARAQIISALCQDTKRNALIICAGEAEATRFAEDTEAFGKTSEVFPSRDFVLRAVESQNHEYEYRRLEVMGNVVGGRTAVVCAGVEAVLQLTMPKKEFCDNTLTIKSAMAISIIELTTRLYGAGYQRRFQVEGPGQFSVRGGIVDIYAPDMRLPARVEFWGDEIDTIHSFDIVSQRREAQLKKIYLSPAREVLFGSTADAAQLLRNAIGKISEPR
ncbi:MAG: transcription-repair coupling factor, partial [Oscillospiraceae bacterium]